MANSFPERSIVGIERGVGPSLGAVAPAIWFDHRCLENLTRDLRNGLTFVECAVLEGFFKLSSASIVIVAAMGSVCTHAEGRTDVRAWSSASDYNP